MHAVFMVFGIKHDVDRLLGDMQAQKFPFRMFKKGKKDIEIFLQGRLCYAPFGIWEYCFPIESMNEVLTTLDFHMPDNIKPRNKFGKIRLALLRFGLKLDKTPEFKTDKKLFWYRDNVTILPLGVRYDDEITEPPVSNPYAGWTHEGI